MSKNKSEGAKKSKLSSEKFAQFPDWSRELMENADESDKPMLREHIEGYVDAEGVKVKPTAPTSEEESGVMAERLRRTQAPRPGRKCAEHTGPVWSTSTGIVAIHTAGKRAR